MTPIRGLVDRIREAQTLMEDIDNNPLHPANDARHPEHAASLEAYRALEQWCQGQQRLIEQRERQARAFAGL